MLSGKRLECNKKRLDQETLRQFHRDERASPFIIYPLLCLSANIWIRMDWSVYVNLKQKIYFHLVSASGAHLGGHPTCPAETRRGCKPRTLGTRHISSPISVSVPKEAPRTMCVATGPPWSSIPWMTTLWPTRSSIPWMTTLWPSLVSNHFGTHLDDLIKRQVIGFTLRTCWRPPSHQFLLFCGFHEGEGLGATLRVVGLSETRCWLDGCCEVGREENNENCEMICIFLVPAYYC